MDTEEENPDETETPMSSLKKVLTFFGVFLFLIFMIHYGVKMFRNTDPRELSERFIRSNEFLRNETGGITRLSSGQAKVSGGEYEITRLVTGTQKQLVVTVMIFCNKGGGDPGIGCTVKSGTYRGESPLEKPSEIPRGWYDNFLIV